MTSHSPSLAERKPFQHAVHARALAYDSPYSELSPASPRKPIVLSPSLAPKLNCGLRLIRNGWLLLVVSISFHSASWFCAGVDHVASGRKTPSMMMSSPSFHQLSMR